MLDCGVWGGIEEVDDDGDCLGDDGFRGSFREVDEVDEGFELELLGLRGDCIRELLV